MGNPKHSGGRYLVEGILTAWRACEGLPWSTSCRAAVSSSLAASPPPHEWCSGGGIASAISASPPIDSWPMQQLVGNMEHREHLAVIFTGNANLSRKKPAGCGGYDYSPMTNRWELIIGCWIILANSSSLV